MIKIEDLKVGDVLYHESNNGVLYKVEYITKQNVLVLFDLFGEIEENLISKEDLKYYSLKPIPPNYVCVYIVTFRTKTGKIDTRKFHDHDDMISFRVFNDVLNVSEYMEFNND